jgi:hypothetical protein
MTEINQIGTLHTIAQVAIALIGFSGIVSIFGERSKLKWTAQESLHLFTLLAPSLTVLFCSFVPILLATLSLNEETIWRISNLVLGVLHAAIFCRFLLSARNMKVSTEQKVSTSLGALVITAHFLAVFGINPWYDFTFIFGLLWFLYVGISHFLSLFRPSDESIT